MTLRSSIIYKYSCARCASGTYVGLTTRPLHMRIAEHQGISFRSKNPSQHPVSSAIRDHSLKCSKQISNSEFSIIGQEKPGHHLEILESLYIFKLRPKLNNHMSSFPLKFVYWPGSLISEKLPLAAEKRNPHVRNMTTASTAASASYIYHVPQNPFPLLFYDAKSFDKSWKIPLILCLIADDGYR